MSLRLRVIRIRRLFVLVAAAVVPAKLAGAQEITVRDSAGIEIVTVSAAAYRDLATWRLSDQPVASIGVAQEPEPQVFGAILDAKLLDDGRIAVADAQAEDIRVFRMDGSYVSRLGGRGEGPGEFLNLSMIGPLSEGQIGAYDGRQRRVTIFASDGTVEDAWHTAGCPSVDGSPSARGCIITPTGFFADGSLLVSTNMARRVPPIRNRIEGVYEGGSVWIGVLDHGSWLPFDSLQQAPVILVQDSDGLAYPVPVLYGPEPTWAVGGDWLAYGNADRPEVQLRRIGGGQRRILRLEIPLRPRPEDLDNLKDFDWTGLPVGPKWPEAVAGWIDRFEHNAYVPFFGELKVDRSGNLWVAEYRLPEFTQNSNPRQWTVFDNRGQPRGQITLPGALLDANDSTVLIGAEDASGVPRIDVYAIER